jgi:hypothetical protein
MAQQLAMGIVQGLVKSGLEVRFREEMDPTNFITLN